MAVYLGIDTSNYTTSAAAFDDVSGCVFQKKMLLPVKSGERGLRQSDAVFHHTQQLWQVVSAVIDECGKPDFIGASYAPRDAEGSYMPCFTVGLNTAKCLSSALGVPLYEFSHQAGHVAAAVYSSGHIELFDREFIAFHVSGGTTEALLVRPDEEKLFKMISSAELSISTRDRLLTGSALLWGSSSLRAQNSKSWRSKAKKYSSRNPASRAQTAAFRGLKTSASI